MENQDGMTESTLSTTPTDKPAKMGRPPRQSAAPVPWSVRGVEPDTRRVIEKAAERAGKTIGQYINEDLRQYAQEQLKKGSQPPARPEDLRTEIDDLKAVVIKLAEQSELDKQRDEELRIIREAIQQRPASFREWLFGKK